MVTVLQLLFLEEFFSIFSAGIYWTHPCFQIICKLWVLTILKHIKKKCPKKSKEDVAAATESCTQLHQSKRKSDYSITLQKRDFYP
jgi:phage FluMu protein Com